MGARKVYECEFCSVISRVLFFFFLFYFFFFLLSYSSSSSSPSITFSLFSFFHCAFSPSCLHLRDSFHCDPVTPLLFTRRGSPSLFLSQYIHTCLLSIALFHSGKYLTALDIPPLADLHRKKRFNCISHFALHKTTTRIRTRTHSPPYHINCKWIG